jgi:hypothetical protein
MNLQQLKRSFERFKRWQRRTPTFRLASKEEHRCLCCGRTYRAKPTTPGIYIHAGQKIAIP